LRRRRPATKRRITVAVTGPFTTSDLVGVVEHQLSAGAWRYGLIIDARDPLILPPMSDFRALASRVSELIAEHGPRGPIAVVSRDASTIGAAHRHVLLTGKIETIEVFWDWDDGQRWLDGRLARTGADG
jgi:hypothetical protein